MGQPCHCLYFLYSLRKESNKRILFSDALIGVHCTHGLNRTGYMVCRYLIQKLKWDPQKAIDGNCFRKIDVHALFYYFFFLLFSSFQ